MEIVDLGALPGTDGDYEAQDINAAGQICGSCVISSVSHPVIWEPGGSITELDPLTSGKSAVCYGINASGQTCGRAFDSSNRSHPVMWDTDGTITDLGWLASGNSGEAWGINDDGHVVGWSYITAGGPAQRAFYYDGTMVELDPLTSGTRTFANAIDSADNIVGWSWNASNVKRAVHWAGAAATPTDLDFSTSDNDEATGLNEAGQVCGWSLRSGDSPAVFWDGTATDLDLATDGSIAIATALNAAGMVVGYGDTTGGATIPLTWNLALATLPLLSGGTDGYAYGVYGTVIVGIAYDGSFAGHAVKWITAETVEGWGIMLV